MVIVVEVQAMNILEMHLVAWSFISKQRSTGQDRALMTEGGMKLLTTARTPTPEADENLHARPAPRKQRDDSLGGFLMKRGCVNTGQEHTTHS